MIQDGYITHGNFMSPLYHWDFPTPLSSALFVAIQTTILSYQATALFFDLLLGIKKPTQASAANIHTLLLTENASLTCFLAATLRKNFLDRLRFHRDIPRHCSIARSKKSISPRNILKVCFLFILAPVLNIFSVLLTLEHETAITFREAQFGGAALGINLDLSIVLKQPSAAPCNPLLFRSALDADPLFKCEICATSTPTVLTTREAPYSVELQSTPTGQITVRQVISSFESLTDVFIDCQIGNWTYRVKPIVDAEAARVFVQHASDVMQRHCVREGTSAPVPDFQSGYLLVEKRGTTISQAIPCTRTEPLPPAVRDGIRREIPQAITMINSAKFEISGEVSHLAVDYSSFKTADDLVMMTRVRRNASPIVLSILVVVVLIVRVIIKFLTSNDVHDGVEAIMKSFAGIPIFGPSLLAEDKDIKYDYKYQNNGEAQYGVLCNSLPEVDKFESGVIGKEDEYRTDR